MTRRTWEDRERPGVIMVAETDAFGNLSYRTAAPHEKVCRCCGEAILGILERDGYPIHTRCIPKHWDKHAKGINASRCREFRNIRKK